MRLFILEDLFYDNDNRIAFFLPFRSTDYGKYKNKTKLTKVQLHRTRLYYFLLEL